jgi:hypothetical protein
MITPRDLHVLLAVAHYYTLTRAQISRLHFPEDADGRITRKRLQAMLDAGLLNRTHMQVVNPSQGAPAPVYYPSREGCAFVAQETGDERLRFACTQTPTWQNLYHWVRVAETHILFDHALLKTPGVAVREWYGEWSVVNPEEKLPERKYRLYTKLNDKLVCVPDAAFLLEKAGHRKAFYLEQDRDTTRNAERVVAQKHAGYAMLAEVAGHLRHFPTATVPGLTVLMIAPTERRRDALRKAFAAKPGAHLWRFAAQVDLKPESLLSSPVWHSCSGPPVALLKREGGGG